MTRRVLLVACALLSLPVSTASAHSLLIASVPAPDTVVTAASSVSLRFNNRIEKKLSRIRLVPTAGDAYTLELRTDGDVDTLEAPLPALGPGRYRVEWRVLSTDGHVVSGAFTFRIQ